MRYLPCLVLFLGCSQATSPAPKTDNTPAPVTMKAPASASAPTSVSAKLPAPTSVEVDDDEAPAPPLKASKLIASLPAATLPLKTVAMSGPYAKKDDFCKASLLDLNQRLLDIDRKELLGDGQSSYVSGLTEVCPKTSKTQGEEGGYMYANLIIKEESPSKGPYQRIQFVHHENMPLDMYGRGSVELIVQMKGGWYGIQLLAYKPDWQGAAGSGANLRTVKSLSITDAIPGGEEELVFIVNSTYEKGGRIGDEGSTSKDLLFVCGVGSGGQPACYPPIRVADAEITNIYDDDTEDLKKTISTSWRLKEPYLKEGQLVLEVESGEAKIPARIKKLLGVHPLSFP